MQETVWKKAKDDCMSLYKGDCGQYNLSVGVVVAKNLTRQSY